eukprot:CAMPEP_0197191766 /NCGR_PEP_ID=MMETSP1423-20130617/23979_1 /TAXON_ID=476441 /ORGANISM="Pseudo-nitzschia heimii, Strain UNC1101" /LENGTH=80 /DNA_ID=CAMNT_0042644507 /DNA_START=37 /DNA_END=276 /DNA_ORIENTATION=-
MSRYWSIEEYCSKQQDILLHNPDGYPSVDVDHRYWSTLLGDNDHESSRNFLIDLNLPTAHPFCIANSPARFDYNNSIPPM